jgi:GTPase Era involved in 16S rRNA processing
VAVVGEFRSGRSSLVNALLGTAALPASFKVQIPHPVVISYAPRASLALELIDRRRVVTDWDSVSRAPAHDVRLLHLGLPADELRSMRLIDTPACSSDGSLLDERVLGLCRRADVVVWCTPAVQAWKASEQDAWLALPKRIRRRGILAVTYKDLIPSGRDLSRLGARLSAEAAQHFAKVVMVANIEAMRARQQSDVRRRALWEASGGALLACAVSAVIAASRQWMRASM